MNILVIDTATDAVICGLLASEQSNDHNNDDACAQVVAQYHNDSSTLMTIAEARYATTRRHAEILTTMISYVLTRSAATISDVDCIVVGNGPGAFTGLRVGLATGLGLAIAWEVPIFPSCSLDAFALQYFADHPDCSQDITVVTDARRKECFWAQYRSDAHSKQYLRITPHAVGSPSDLPVLDSIVVGSQRVYDAYPMISAHAQETCILDYYDCASLYRARRITSGDVCEISPMYLRKPDATAAVGFKKVVPLN